MEHAVSYIHRACPSPGSERQGNLLHVAEHMHAAGERTHDTEYKGLCILYHAICKGHRMPATGSALRRKP